MSESVVWWKNGDHPDDNSQIVTRDDFVGRLTEGEIVGFYTVEEEQLLTELCSTCSQPFVVHGWIAPENSVEADGEVVHPGDIVTKTDEGKYTATRVNPVEILAAKIEAEAARTQTEQSPA